MTYRSNRLLLFFLAHEMLLGAFYFQFVKGLEPCPLCIFQRVAVLFIAFFALLAGLHQPRWRGRNIYDLLVGLSAFAGALVAGRQVWLQYLPKDQVPTCGPGLNYLLDTLPLGEALSTIFRGSGECAEITWRFLGLTMPGWTLLIFVAVLTWMISNIWRRRRARPPWRS